MLPKLESIFNQFSDKNSVVSIPKLEINLGQINLKNEEEIIRKIERYSVKQLAEIVSAKQTNKTKEIVAIVHLKDFLFYLENGYLSWSCSSKNLSELERNLYQIKEILQVKDIGRIMGILTQVVAIQRLSWQFSTPFFILFLKALQKRFGLDSIFPATIATKLDRVFIHEKSPQVQKEKISKLLLTSIEKSSKKESGAESKSKINETSNYVKEDAINDLYCKYVGIILIHPFLKKFFETFLLLNDDEFKNEAAKEKAVHLLYYIATGKENPEEPDTVFLKLICGLPLSFPLRKKIRLTQQEKEESENLLTAVLGYWTKLKKTSIHGLREGFIQREGKVMFENDNWRIIVEQKGIDVLMSSFPWGVSIVKLTWLKDKIWVDWA